MNDEQTSQKGSSCTRCHAWVWIIPAALLLFVVADQLTRMMTYRSWRTGLHEFKEISERYQRQKKISKRITNDILFSATADFPLPVESRTQPEAEPVWTPTRDFPLEGFVSDLGASTNSSAKVRIAFIGDSTTRTGYPEIVGRILDDTFGPGIVETINLGVSASNVHTTKYLFERFLPQIRPHVVVYYQGRNDLVFEHMRALAVLADALDRNPNTIFAIPNPRRGLLDLISPRKRWTDHLPKEQQRWRDNFFVGRVLAPLWDLQRTAWEQGFDLVISTLAVPTVEGGEQAYFDATVRYLWPMLPSFTAYRAMVDRYNKAMHRFSSNSGTLLLDVAAAIQGGRENFSDICHRTEKGKRLHAEIVADALVPLVAKIYGGKDTSPTPTKVLDTPVQITLSDDNPTVNLGECVQGPCPVETCFVPETSTSPYGYAAGIITTGRDYIEKRLGYAGTINWYLDDGPATRVHLSRFCIDKNEASEASRQACVEAGKCPPFQPSTSDSSKTLAATMPTYRDAQRYCAWRGGRLPTSAEWELAARGSQGLILPWGSGWSGKEANFCGSECESGFIGDPNDGWAGSAPLDTFKKTSPFGLLNSAGNLWEWVYGCFDETAHCFMADGTRDPREPDRPDCRHFVRGGSYLNFPIFLETRTAEGAPDTTPASWGVRCVFDMGTQPNEDWRGALRAEQHCQIPRLQNSR